MFSHFVEVVPNSNKADQAEAYSYEAKPNQTVFILTKSNIIVTDGPVHIKADLNGSTAGKVILLQELPIVAVVTHLDTSRVMHLKAPT